MELLDFSYFRGFLKNDEGTTAVLSEFNHQKTNQQDILHKLISDKRGQKL
jgi:hypothetical protein